MGFFLLGPGMGSDGSKSCCRGQISIERVTALCVGKALGPF